MKIADFIIIALVAAIVFFAIRKIIKNKKTGKCNCGCSCSSDSCQSCNKKISDLL